MKEVKLVVAEKFIGNRDLEDLLISAFQTELSVLKNATSSGIKALFTSSLTACVGAGVGGVDYYSGALSGGVANGCGGLMPTLTLGFGEGIKAFFGWADDAVIYLWE